MQEAIGGVSKVWEDGTNNKISRSDARLQTWNHTRSSPYPFTQSQSKRQHLHHRQSPAAPQTYLGNNNINNNNPYINIMLSNPSMTCSPMIQFMHPSPYLSLPWWITSKNNLKDLQDYLYHCPISTLQYSPVTIIAKSSRMQLFRERLTMEYKYIC